MPSLWSQIKKSYSFIWDREVFPDVDTIGAIVAPALISDPVLINATELVAILKSQRSPLNTDWDLTPGYAAVWLEYITAYEDGDKRAAVLVLRAEPEAWPTKPIPSSAAHSLFFYAWFENNGAIELTGFAAMLINSLGIPERDFMRANWSEEDAGRDEQFAIALEILTTMNTRGTRVERIEKHCQVVKPNRAPCSVWHTIHLPKMPSVPLEGAETSDTILERRLHWVRAHRKDYRQGAGMFGRVKALVWVPEFQRGNPELGTVRQSYAVAGKK